MNISHHNLRLAPVDVLEIGTKSLDPFASLFDVAEFKQIRQKLEDTVEGMYAEVQNSKPRFFHVNSTSSGGGVSEILWFLVKYFNGIGINTRWLVIKGDEEFFRITKRIHNGLHGYNAEGGMLFGAEHTHYQHICEQNLEEILKVVQKGDVCVLHDPQTAGLIEGLKKAGVYCVWRCHIGSELKQNFFTLRSWKFLRSYVLNADRFVFTLKGCVPDWIPLEKVHIIQPSIDPFTPKNQDLPEDVCERILFKAGLIEDDSSPEERHSAQFSRSDGKEAEVENPADVMHAGPLPKLSDGPLIVQVSRWDHLKDMGGVMRAFAEEVLPKFPEANLILAGPEVASVTDDPEGLGVLRSVVKLWRELSPSDRAHVEITTLPMDDIEENAAIVNALQRRATIICQKSLFEGFGLTVTEAMWKGTAVVASGIGGIKAQITDQKEGLLIDNPTDLRQFGRLLNELLGDPQLRKKLASNARDKVRRNYLPIRHLQQYAELFQEMLADANERKE